MKRNRLYIFLIVFVFAGILVSQTSEPTAWTSWHEFLQFYKTGATTLTNKTLTSPTLGGSVNLTGTINYLGASENIAGTDSFVVSPSYTPTMTTGSFYIFKADTINTGACVLIIAGIDTLALKKLTDQALGNSHIEANSMVWSIYDGTNLQVQTVAAN